MQAAIAKAAFCDIRDTLGIVDRKGHLVPCRPSVGVVRNETLNRTVFLRCVGKRWLQEREDKPDEFMPVVANHFLFKSLTITRYL